MKRSSCDAVLRGDNPDRHHPQHTHTHLLFFQLSSKGCVVCSEASDYSCSHTFEKKNTLLSRPDSSRLSQSIISHLSFSSSCYLFCHFPFLISTSFSHLFLSQRLLSHLLPLPLASLPTFLFFALSKYVVLLLSTSFLESKPPVHCTQLGRCC